MEPASTERVLPSKRIVHDAAHPRYSEIESACLHVNFPELIRQKDEINGHYWAKKYRTIVGDGITVFDETVSTTLSACCAYPSMLEALKIIGLSFIKDVSKLSCCAE